MTAATSFDPERAVEIFAGDGYGTGYRVTSDLILTAKHFLGDDGVESGATVRDLRGRVGTGSVWWRSTEADVALVKLSPSPGAETAQAADGVALAAADIPPVRLGRFPPDPGSTREFDMLGWPRAGAQAVDSGWVRDPVRVEGEIRLAEVVGGRTRSGLMRLRPSERYPSLGEDSWWSGMSGAAVFSGGLLVGVQVAQPREELPEYLAAQAIEPLADLLEVLAEHGVGYEVALDPDASTVASYLSRLIHRLGAAPAWFPRRLGDRLDTVDLIYQPPELELAAEGGRWLPCAGLEQVVATTVGVVIEGEAGAGKSWLLAAHARRLARGATAALYEGEEVEIPLVCRLAEIGERDDLAAFVTRASRSTPGGTEQLRSAIARMLGSRLRVRLIVDGVDEATESQKQALALAVDELLADPGERNDVAGLVLGSRPGELELPPDPRLSVVRVSPFASEQQERFVAAWFATEEPSMTADTVRALIADWRMGSAFRNPLLLTLACLTFEGGEHTAVAVHNGADLFREAVIRLIDNAHRSARIRSLGTIEQRRARVALIDALKSLAFRLFGDDGYRPFLAESEISDIDAQVLDSCVETGLIALRSDGGIEFANRSIASYLAAQHCSTPEGWQGILERVWENDAARELASYLLHALVKPLLGEPDHPRVDHFLDDVESAMSAGDPGFILLHAIAAGLSWVPEDSAYVGWRELYSRRLQAHFVTSLDARAASSLSVLDPEELARLAVRRDVWVMLEIGLLLAAAGRDEGYALLNMGLRSDPSADKRPMSSLDLDAQLPIMEWLERRRDSRGIELLKALADDSEGMVRRFACLLLVHAGIESPLPRLQWILSDDAARDTADELVAAGLLAEAGDEAGSERLRERIADGAPVDVITICSWLQADVADAEERLRSHLAHPLALYSIGAAVCLTRLDAAAGLDELEQQTRSCYGRHERVAAAVFMASLDRDRGMQRLTAMAEDHASEDAVAAAAQVHELDAQEGARLLRSIATDADVEVDERVAATRLLTYFGYSEGALILNRISGGADPDAAAIDFVQEKSVVVGAIVGVREVLQEVRALLSTPADHLEQRIAAFRQVSDLAPPSGVPEDPDYMIVGGSEYGLDAGAAPGLLRRLDLTQELDRLALAVAIPILDVPQDREYLVSRSIAIAPDDDWLRLLTHWAVGDFSDSPFARKRHKYGRVPERIHEALHIHPDYIVGGWSNAGWIAQRCAPVVLKYPTAHSMLELAHLLRAASKVPVPLILGRTLSSLAPLRGLSDPAIRACVCGPVLRAMVEALDDADPPFPSVREEYARRAVALRCAHQHRGLGRLFGRS